GEGRKGRPCEVREEPFGALEGLEAEQGEGPRGVHAEGQRAVEIDAHVRGHEADLLPIRALVPSIPEKPGGDPSVFVGQADQGDDRTNSVNRDLRLVGAHDREEDTHLVTSGLDYVRRTPQCVRPGY